MLLLKEQPAGTPAPPPVLVWRAFLSGAPFPCTVFYESADCSPTAGWPVVAAPQSGAACIDASGRAWAAPPATNPTTVTFGSRLTPSWDVVALDFSWACATPGGTATNILLGADMGVPPAVTSRIYWVPVD
jgi:hypothetical protein